MQNRIRRPRLRALVVACALAVAAMVVPAAPAHADDRSKCLTAGKVWVIVQQPPTTTRTGCASEFSTGLIALRSAGFTTDDPLFVNRIDGHPATVDGAHYWSYWHATPDAAGRFNGYSYAQSGANAYRPDPGTIQAWRYVSLSAPTSEAMPTAPLPSAPGTSTKFGDQDGDGQADVIAVDEDGTLLQYSVRGDRLSSAYSIGRGWQTFSWISNVPDVDGDRLTDLVGRRAEDGTLWLLRGQGGGTYGSAKQVGRGWNGLSLLTVMEDITGDGLPDLLGRAANGDLIRYSFTGGPGFLANASVTGKNWSGITMATTVGDFSDDGVPDLLAVSGSGALLRYSIRNGQIVAAHQVGRNWGAMGVITSPGDFTWDGNRDLVALRADGTLWAYTNLGAGKWGRVWQIEVGLTRLEKLA